MTFLFLHKQQFLQLVALKYVICQEIAEIACEAVINALTCKLDKEVVCCLWCVEEEVNHLHFYNTAAHNVCSNGATFEWDDVCKNKSIYKFTQQNAYNSYEQKADKIGAHIFSALRHHTYVLDKCYGAFQTV